MKSIEKQLFAALVQQTTDKTIRDQASRTYAGRRPS
jgi:hypothetical protein